ncbi:50S ribosomal protein L28 [Candidatus Vidania fulgoroideae]|nr:50S ribosomal protein L28 [Candidatus Vidania fulgoroideae]
MRKKKVKKKPLFGNSISKSKKKTRRKFKINKHKKISFLTKKNKK